MNFLTAILEAFVGFVRRNPLTVLLILVLALGAPALLRGIATFILYGIMTLLIIGIALIFYFRWRFNRMRRQMEEQFGQGNFRPGEGFGSTFAGNARPHAGREGDVKVHQTAETPRKRVSNDVGDYVDFEETKENR